ncbi:MAG: hypothetical protein V1735_07585, partial [Nanoarchaeota archaeon]
MMVDTFFEIQTADLIIQNNYWAPNLGTGMGGGYYGFNPLLHFNIAISSLLTGLSTLVISKYFLIYFIRIFQILLLLIILKKVIKRPIDDPLIYFIVLTFMFSHIIIVYFLYRRTFGAYFLLFCIYSIISDYKDQGIINRIIL